MPKNNLHEKDKAFNQMPSKLSPKQELMEQMAKQKPKPVALILDKYTGDEADEKFKAMMQEFNDMV